MLPKSAPIALALCLPFAGCQIFKKSATWKTVVNARIDTRGADDPSRAYATGLHRELAESRVEHKVVAYRYHYWNRDHESVVAERTAVIYRDDVDPNHPWWLKDERIGRPMWLVNGDLETQVRSYARCDVEIVASHEFSAADGKTVARLELPNAVGRSLRLSPSVSTSGRTSAPTARRSLEPDRATLFRRLHDTEFDPNSVMDREKMRAIEGRTAGGSLS